jgi:hypothetical protein
MHIGETQRRFRIVIPRMVRGEKSRLIAAFRRVVGAGR